MGSEFSEWLKIKSGVPQGLVLGPICFNVFTKDLLLEPKESKICKFADDATMYTSEKNVLSLSCVLI